MKAISNLVVYFPCGLYKCLILIRNETIHFMRTKALCLPHLKKTEYYNQMKNFKTGVISILLKDLLQIQW